MDNDTELLDSYYDEDEDEALPPPLNIEFPQTSTHIPTLSTLASTTTTSRNDSYSIDQVTALPPGRKRTYAKLDADRLLGENGLLLLKTQGPKLKFRGRHHEVSDLRKFLNFYQLWGHQLFPKMKFHDLIEQTESVCRQKRCKVALNAWVDEYHQEKYPHIPTVEPERNSDGENDKNSSNERNESDDEDEDRLERRQRPRAVESSSNVHAEQVIGETEVDENVTGTSSTKGDASVMNFSSQSEGSVERPTSEKEGMIAPAVPDSHSIFTFEDDDDEDFGQTEVSRERPISEIERMVAPAGSQTSHSIFAFEDDDDEGLGQSEVSGEIPASEDKGKVAPAVPQPSHSTFAFEDGDDESLGQSEVSDERPISENKGIVEPICFDRSRNFPFDIYI